MGSIKEHIHVLSGGGGTSSATKIDIKNVSDELIVHLNGLSIGECDRAVTQTLNYNFKVGPTI